MSSGQLLAHFDRISEAPIAIPRLRRFVIDLAVRGKLVRQVTDGETVHELLDRIKAENERLSRLGETSRRDGSLPPIKGGEILFEIPRTWRWVRLGDIASYIQRGKSPKYASGDGLPVISQKCVQWDGLDLERARLITRESLATYEKVRFLRENDLLWNSTGTGTIGRIIRLNVPPGKLVCDSHVTVVRCLEVDAEYVRSWLRSDYVYGVIEEKAAGSTNQVELTLHMAIHQVVPLPPLAEQRLIVAMLSKMLVLCGQLESVQLERENLRQRLLDAVIRDILVGA